MSDGNDRSNLNRRHFLKATGSLAAGATVMGGLSTAVFGSEDNTIRLALLGCGTAARSSSTPWRTWWRIA